MARCCGASRYVYNWGLAEWKRQYEAGEKPSSYGLCKKFNHEKDEICPWIRELPYAVTEATFANLNSAFQNFFRRVKNGEKPGYPRFKKRGTRNSFRVRNLGIENDRIRITGIGWVRLREPEYIPVDAERYGVYATISERAGRWFISVLAEDEVTEIETTGESIGVDVGINKLAVCSDGKVFENPKALYKYERKLKRLQRELSRRERGSNNRAKTRAKIAKCYARIADIRKYSLHDISHYVTETKRPAVVVIEDLNVKGMLTNHHIARAMSDAAVSELHRQITYKAGWSGIEVIKADRWFASSKTCSECGSVKTLLKLSERTYACENCGAVIDRDLNAALNLAALSEPPNGRGLPGELECGNASL